MSRRSWLGLLALALSVFAATTVDARYFNNPGSVCRALHGDESTLVDYLFNGVTSRKPFPQTQTLICPLMRTQPFGSGATVFVDVEHFVGARTECTAFSHSFTGELLGSRSAAFDGDGFGEIAIDLQVPQFSDTFSDYSVACTILGGGAVAIYGVDLSELES